MYKSLSYKYVRIRLWILLDPSKLQHFGLKLNLVQRIWCIRNPGRTQELGAHVRIFHIVRNFPLKRCWLRVDSTAFSACLSSSLCQGAVLWERSLCSCRKHWWSMTSTGWCPEIPDHPRSGAWNLGFRSCSSLESATALKASVSTPGWHIGTVPLWEHAVVNHGKPKSSSIGRA